MRKHQRTSKLIFLVLLALVTTGICVGTSPSASAGSTRHAIASLQHSPTGTANLDYAASSNRLYITISLTGLAPNSIHPTAIHYGSCQHSRGIKYVLHNLVADSQGQASATTIIYNVKGGIPATGWAINVHNGPDLTTADQYTPIACADVNNPSNASNLLFLMGPTSGANESASGLASLSLKTGTLTVTLTVTGLVPGSSHAAHIHAGDCYNTQGVLYDLSPLVADATGNASETVTFTGVTAIPASGWDINVHYSTDLSTQTGYNPILCGNVQYT